MAWSLRSNLTFFSAPSTGTKPISGRNRTHVTIHCGPRDNRGPLVKGRVLSTEAIQAVQLLKRVRRGDQTNLDQQVSKALHRLIKNDLIATFNELLRQGHCEVAVKVFSFVRSEYWYKTDLTLYADLVAALAGKGMPDEIDRLIRDLEGEGEIPCDNKGLIRLVKALIAAERRESTLRLCGLLKNSGCGSTYSVDEYVVQTLSRGLRRLGEAGAADEVKMEFGRFFRGKLENH